MDDIIYNSDGTVDWTANGWPEPNPYGLMDDDVDMPDDIFDIWQSECEYDWGIDE